MMFLGSHGTYLRVSTCDQFSPLQQFQWDDGTLNLVGTQLAIVFRGTTANINSDPIILGDLGEPSTTSRKEWMILN